MPLQLIEVTRLASEAYDYEHQQTRLRLLPHAYNTPCPRCGELMLQGQDLDLGHSTDHALDPGAKGDRIEHTNCNRSAGAALAQAISKFAPSRKW